MWGIAIEVDRVQWGVGNGGFHTEDIRDLENASSIDRPLVRVVYDCGTLRPGSLIAKEIDVWAHASGGDPFVNGHTNVLVISHFDRDHVNGLTRLWSAGFLPDYVILPFLSPVERVLQLLKNIAAKTRGLDEEQDRADDRLADRLVSDPAAVLGDLWPEAELFLVAESGEGIGDAESPPDPIESDTAEPEAPAVIAVVDGKNGIRVTGSEVSEESGRRVLWEYRWREHRAPAAAASRLNATLKSKLALLLNLTPKQVESPPDVWKAISAANQWKAVATLYKQHLNTKDLNPYSLVLWSGPGRFAKMITASRGATLRGIYPQRDGALPAWLRSGGWLGTGDAVLSSKQDVDLLFSHFGDRIGEVDVLNAPHHGSRHNSASELYDRVPARSGTVLTPGDGKNGYRHPHAEMVKAALTAGRAVVRVGDSIDQRFMWSVTVRA